MIIKNDDSKKPILTECAMPTPCADIHYSKILKAIFSATCERYIYGEKERNILYLSKVALKSGLTTKELQRPLIDSNELKQLKAERKSSKYLHELFQAIHDLRVYTVQAKNDISNSCNDFKKTHVFGDSSPILKNKEVS